MCTMTMNVILIYCAVLIQVVLHISAEKTHYPRLKKISRKDLPWPNEGNSRLLYLLNKPTTRPNKANIIYITVPTGNTKPESSPTWPAYTTRRPYHPKPAPPAPQPPKGQYPIYPYIFQFLPPIFLPVPGWTGNPPPPYKPPSSHSSTSYEPSRPDRPHRPESIDPPRPPRPRPPTEEPFDFFERGTPTATTSTEDEQNEWLEPKPVKQDNVEPDELIQLPDEELLNRKKKPRPTKKPKPTKKPAVPTAQPDNPLLAETLLEVKPDSESGANQQIKRKRKPSPKPTEQPAQDFEDPNLQEADTVDPLIPDIEDIQDADDVDDEEEVTDEVQDDLLANRKKKPRPSRKPVLATVKPDNQDQSNGGLDIQVPGAKPKPGSSAMFALDSVIESEDDSLTNRRKKPRPSRRPKPSGKPRPSQKPTQVTDNTENERPDSEESQLEIANNPEPSYGVPINLEDSFGVINKDLLVNRIKQPMPTRKPQYQLNVQQSNEEDSPILQENAPESDADETDDSTEYLGPEEDLIAVHRKGKPMQIRLVDKKVISPWKLFKLPIGDDWQ